MQFNEIIMKTSRSTMCNIHTRLFHCIESVITLCARAPEKVILNLPSNGVGYIGVNRLCHGVTNLLNVKKSRYHEEQLNK